MQKKRWMAWMLSAAIAVTGVGQTGVMAADFTDEAVSVTETAEDVSEAEEPEGTEEAAGSEESGADVSLSEEPAEIETADTEEEAAGAEVTIETEEETAPEAETAESVSEETEEAALFTAGEEEADAAGDGELEYNYNEPLSYPGGDRFLPGYARNLDMSCWVYNTETDEGEDVNVPITNVTISDSGTWDDSGNEVSDGQGADRVEIGQNDDGYWYVFAKDDNEENPLYGWVRLKYEYNLLEDESTTKSGEVTIIIDSDYYGLNASYRRDSTMMRTNDAMTVDFSLRHDIAWDEEVYVEDFSVQINMDEENAYNTDLISVKVNEDGKSLTITSNDNTGSTNILVTAFVGEDAMADEWVNVNVEEGYYEILPAYLTDSNNDEICPGFGEELDLADYDLKLYWFDDMYPNGGEVQAEYRIRLDYYDPNIWDVKSGTENELIPTLIRKSKKDDDLRIVAERENEDGTWEELANRIYYIEWMDDYEVDFEYSYGSRDIRVLYNDSPLTLTLTEEEGSPALPDGCTVEWSVTDGEGNATDIVTLGDGENDYQKILTANELERDVCVKVKVLYGEAEVTGTETWIWVTGTCYNYDFPAQEPAGSDLLPGWTYDIPSKIDCYVENADHPGGENVAVKITKAEITSQGTEWDDDGLVNDPTVNAIELESLEESGWRVTAVDGGSAFVTLTYTAVEDGTEKTQDIQFNVSEHRYSLEISLPHSGLNRMQKGDTIEAQVQLLHQWLDEEGYEQSEYVEDWKLEFSTDEDGNVTYDTGVLSAEISGDGQTKTVTVTSEDYGDTDIWLRAFVPGDDGEYTSEVNGGYFGIHVYPTVYVTEPGALSENPLVGEELDLNGKLSTVKYFTLDDGSTDHEVVDTFTYRLADYDTDVWSVKEGTENDPIPVLIREKPWSTSIRVVMVDEDGNDFESQEYRLDEAYYGPDFELSYGKTVYSENRGKEGDLLTDVPLTISLDTETFSKVTDYTVSWTVMSYNSDENVWVQEDEELDVIKKAETSTSVTLQGKTEDTLIWVGADVAYKNVNIGGSYIYLTSTTCEKRGHEWSSWKTTSKATVFKAAVQTRTCGLCGKKETRNYGKKLTATIKFNASSLKLQTKQKTTGFKVTYTNSDSVKSWKSSNTKIVKVSGKTNGTCTITAQKKTGTAYITVKLKSGLSKKLKVTVQKGVVKTTSVTLNKKKASLYKKGTLKLTATVAPFTSGQKVTWSTSNKKVATVKNGKVTAKGAGTCTITATSGSKKATCKITVKVKTTKITGLKSTVTVKKGKTTTLKPKLTPSDSTEGIEYTTSNKKIATVTSAGKIKGIKKGTCTITVTSGSISKKIKVTVK